MIWQRDFSGRRGRGSDFLRARHVVAYGWDLLERHPEGSQAFLPVSGSAFLVIVAREGDAPEPLPLLPRLIRA